MNTLAFMQPYFFPYLGYFMLIQQSSKFMLLEDVQFIYHGWIERNRILKPDGSDWQYINVPLKKHSQKTLIKDIEIDNTQNWKEKFFSQISHYKKKSKYYSEIILLLEKSLSIDTTSITILNKHILETICQYLSINTPIEIFSFAEASIDIPTQPDEWALNVCKEMGYKKYINPPNGQNFFDRDKYKKNNIELYFLQPTLLEYNQGKSSFISGLSIIDLLMFNSVNEIQKQLSYFTYM